MATQTIEMTGEWVEIGTGDLVFNTVGREVAAWQKQVSGAAASVLNEQIGHPMAESDVIVRNSGAEALFVKANAGVKVSVTS